MQRSSLKLPFLFLFSILLPAAALAYLSIQSLRDEREKALEDQRWIAGSLREEFDRAMNVVYTISTAPDPRMYEPVPAVRQFIIVDLEGNLLYPLVLSLEFPERRRSEFRASLSSGEVQEFHEEDYTAASQHYRAARDEARNEQEEAEALIGLARCAWKSGDLEEARVRYKHIIQGYPHVFDADGMHIATLAHLRLAELSSPERAVTVLRDFAEGILDGWYPIYPGSRHYLARADTLARRQKNGVDGNMLDNLLEDLGEIREKVEFVETFSDILKTGIASGMQQGYLTGITSADESYLIVLRPTEEDVRGILVDLDELANALVRTPTGARLEERGFGLRLFNETYGPTFRNTNETDIITIEAASATMPDVKMGIYAGDSSKVVAYYRRRNVLILSVILALAVSIGLGSYMIIRDTVREMKLSRLRAEFVSNVSHELRTPLTSIQMYAETLLGGRYRDREEMTDYLRTLMSESHRLSRLVGNVLDFSRMEEGRKTYDLQDEDLGRIVRATLDSFEYMLRENGFTLEVDIPESLPPIRADREALSAAVSNLVSNAVKYSPEVKEIRVSLRDRGDTEIVEVADRGVGIPESERKRIFDKFYRVENDRVGAGGTGLGLSLVKNIVEAHGGSVEVEGREGGGSVFRLVLPKGRGDAETRRHGDGES